MNDPTSPSPADVCDAELLARFAHTRSEQAFAEIVRRHGGMVMSVCRSKLGDANEAQDAAQAVFLTLARKANNSKARAHTASWLHRVAWYVAVRAVRARKVRRLHETEAARMKQETHEPGREAIDLEALHAGLNHLPASYRLPLILHHLEGHSQAQTAALVGCSANALAVRLHRGRAMLRKQMERGAAVPASALAGLWLEPSNAQASARFVSAASKLAVSAGQGKLAGAAVSESVRMLTESALRRLMWAQLRWPAFVTAELLALALLALILTQQPAQPQPTPTPSVVMTGQIARVGQGSLFLQQSAGTPVEIPFDSTTQLRLNEAPCTTADLRAGLDAAVYKPDARPATQILAYTPGYRASKARPPTNPPPKP